MHSFKTNPFTISTLALLLCTTISLVSAGNKGGGIQNDNSSLKNKARDGFCMDQPGASTTFGANMLMFGCNGGINQKISLSPDQKIIQVLSGNLCLEVAGGNGGAGTNVVQNACDTKKPNQQWAVSAADQTIRTSYNANLCMDVKGGSTDDGTEVIVAICNNNPHQKWSFQ